LKILNFLKKLQTKNNDNTNSSNNNITNNNNPNINNNNPNNNKNTGVDINSLFESMTFDNKPQVNQNQNQHQNQNQNQQNNNNNQNNSNNNNNNQNNSNNNTPQKNNNQGPLNLDFDKIYAEKYNNTGFQNQFLNQNQIFQNPNQFPQQQINPQFLQMIMSNPQLFNQFMQTYMQQNQQQQMGNFGGGNMPPNFGNPQMNMQNHSNNELGNPMEEKQKDMFKDILSYSENKLKNNGKVVENFNPFV